MQQGQNVKNKFYILLVCLLMTGALSAQPGRGQGQRGDMPPNITGILMDAELRQPLEYATVSLLNASDSSLINGIVTDLEGKFEMRARQGDYIVRIQFVTYESQDIPISISRGNPAHLGEIKMRSSTTELDEVVVSGERTQMELKLDKKVYNVGKDLSNLGGSASDILDNLPSVAVDVEGNISLRGSTNVRVLVDGKPSGLVGLSSADALRQLQGDLVERVEVITNPSARYDAEGSAGIINIVLKKEKAKGVNGSFTVNTGVPHNHGGSFSLNLRKDWVNLFANFGGSFRGAPGQGGSYQEFNYPDTAYRTIMDREMERKSINYSARFGSDFYLGEKSTLTAYYLYRFSDENNFTTIKYDDYDGDDNLSQTLREDDQLEDDKNVEYGLNFAKKFERKGHEWTVDLQYQNNNEVESSDVTQYFRASDELPFEPNDYMKSSNDDGEKRWMFQSDYVQPFGDDGTFELGTRMTFRNIHNDYVVQDSEDGIDYEDNPNLSNEFSYLEDIYAVYGIFSNSYNKLDYQFGLRMEVTDLTTELINTGERNDQNYTNLFPSAFFTYELPNTHKLQASYSRRVRRPRFRSLNPFVSISDARNLWVGNPQLQPTFTDSYELGYLQNFEKATLYYGVYYRHTTDVVQRITTVVDTLGLERVRFRRPENLGYSNSVGLEMNGSKDITKWYRISGNANLFWSRTEGIVYEGTDAEQDLSAEALSFTTRLSNNFKFGKIMDGQLNVMYRAPQETTQGRRLAMASIDIGLSKDVLKKNGTISLSARDLFNTRKYRGVTDIENFYEESEFQWRTRQITASFTYRLNQKKRRGGNRRGGDYGGDEEGF